VDAISNVASEIDLLVVAEAQGAIVAHDAYRRLRGVRSLFYGWGILGEYF